MELPSPHNYEPCADVGVPCKCAGQVRDGLCAAASPTSIELLLPIHVFLKVDGEARLHISRSTPTTAAVVILQEI